MRCRLLFEGLTKDLSDWDAEVVLRCTFVVLKVLISNLMKKGMGKTVWGVLKQLAIHPKIRYPVLKNPYHSDIQS